MLLSKHPLFRLENDLKINSRDVIRSVNCKIITQNQVDVFLSGGQVLEDVVFINLDQNNCCAFFNDPTTEPGSTLIVDCQFIQAIQTEAD